MGHSFGTLCRSLSQPPPLRSFLMLGNSPPHTHSNHSRYRSFLPLWLSRFSGEPWDRASYLRVVLPDSAPPPQVWGEKGEEAQPRSSGSLARLSTPVGASFSLCHYFGLRASPLAELAGLLTPQHTPTLLL